MFIKLTSAAGLRAARPALVAPAFAEDFTIDPGSQTGRSSPVRVGTLMAASNRTNGEWEAAGADTRVSVNTIKTYANGFGADTLDPLEVHSVTVAPDDTTLLYANTAHISGATALNKDAAHA